MGKLRGFFAIWVLALVWGEISLGKPVRCAQSILDRGGDIGRIAYDAPARWQPVGLKFEVLEGWLTPAHCYSQESHFASCIAALNRLLRLRQQERAIVPAAFELPLTKVVYRSGGFQILEGELGAQDWMAIREAWTAAFTAKNRVGFGELLQLLRGLSTPAEESWLVAEAVNALLKTVELHSSIEPESTHQSDQESSGETFRGFGTQAYPLGEEMRVYGVLPGSPAARAGVQPGDAFLTLNGQAITPANYRQILDQVSSVRDTLSTLVVRREGQALALSLRAEDLIWPDVRASVIASGGKKWGILTLSGFTGPKIVEDTEKALDGFRAQGVDGIILDLRENGGGYIETGVNIASQFLGENLKVLMQIADDTGEAVMHVTDRPRRVFVPTVVLVGAQTISMAEFLAGILQHFQAAWILGTKTFGKGSILEINPTEALEYLKDYPVVYYKPSAHVVLPSATSPQLYGITPDVYVTHAPGAPEPREMREANFRQARPNLFGQPKPPERANKDEVLACLEREGQAKKIFEGHEWHPIPRDYQMLVAADLLACLNGVK